MRVQLPSGMLVPLSEWLAQHGVVTTPTGEGDAEVTLVQKATPEGPD